MTFECGRFYLLSKSFILLITTLKQWGSFYYFLHVSNFFFNRKCPLRPQTHAGVRVWTTVPSYCWFLCLFSRLVLFYLFVVRCYASIQVSAKAHSRIPESGGHGQKQLHVNERLWGFRFYSAENNFMHICTLMMTNSCFSPQWALEGNALALESDLSNLSMRDDGGASPLHYASSKGHVHVINLIIQIAGSQGQIWVHQGE